MEKLERNERVLEHLSEVGDDLRDHRCMVATCRDRTGCQNSPDPVCLTRRERSLSPKGGYAKRDGGQIAQHLKTTAR